LKIKVIATTTDAIGCAERFYSETTRQTDQWKQ